MAVVLLSDLVPEEQFNFRGYELEMTAPDNSDWIVLDLIQAPQIYAVGLAIGTGSGRVEFTGRSRQSLIENEAEAYEKSWILGDISASDWGYFPVAITAIRFVNISGTIIGTITA